MGPQAKPSHRTHEHSQCRYVFCANRESGQCECTALFEGAACERLSCAVGDALTSEMSSSESSVVCSGHGQCLSMRSLAQVSCTNIVTRWDVMAYSCLGITNRLRRYLLPQWKPDFDRVSVPSMRTLTPDGPSHGGPCCESVTGKCRMMPRRGTTTWCKGASAMLGGRCVRACGGENADERVGATYVHQMREWGMEMVWSVVKSDGVCVCS